MKDESIKLLEFKDEWLDADFNDHGTRRDNLELADLGFTSSLYNAGGLDAVDEYLNATSHAWICADALIRVADSLFNVSRFGMEREPYDTLVKKAVSEVFESMILALENAECHVHYDNDPLNRAENWIRGFGYGLIADIQTLLSDEGDKL